MIAFKQRSSCRREKHRDAAAADDGSGAEFDLDAAIRSLTPQQSRVFELLGQGLPNKLIARALGIAEPTVKMHVSIIFGKLQCTNRIQVALIAMQHVQRQS